MAANTDPQITPAIAAQWGGNPPNSLIENYASKATIPVQHAAANLRNAAILAGPAAQVTLWRQFEDWGNQDATRPWIQAIAKLINGGWGQPRGTDVNRAAAVEMWAWMPRAIVEKYRLEDPVVAMAFAQFVTAVVTDGWEGLDTTGTTVGNATHAELDSMGKFGAGLGGRAR